MVTDAGAITHLVGMRLGDPGRHGGRRHPLADVRGTAVFFGGGAPLIRVAHPIAAGRDLRPPCVDASRQQAVPWNARPLPCIVVSAGPGRSGTVVRVDRYDTRARDRPRPWPVSVAWAKGPPCRPAGTVACRGGWSSAARGRTSGTVLTIAMEHHRPCRGTGAGRGTGECHAGQPSARDRGGHADLHSHPRVHRRRRYAGERRQRQPGVLAGRGQGRVRQRRLQPLRGRHQQHLRRVREEPRHRRDHPGVRNPITEDSAMEWWWGLFRFTAVVSTLWIGAVAANSASMAANAVHVRVSQVRSRAAALRAEREPLSPTPPGFVLHGRPAARPLPPDPRWGWMEVGLASFVALAPCVVLFGCLFAGRWVARGLRP